MYFNLEETVETLLTSAGKEFVIVTAVEKGLTTNPKYVHQALKYWCDIGNEAHAEKIRCKIKKGEADHSFSEELNPLKLNLLIEQFRQKGWYLRAAKLAEDLPDKTTARELYQKALKSETISMFDVSPRKLADWTGKEEAIAFYQKKEKTATSADEADNLQYCAVEVALWMGDGHLAINLCRDAGWLGDAYILSVILKDNEETTADLYAHAVVKTIVQGDRFGGLRVFKGERFESVWTLDTLYEEVQKWCEEQYCFRFATAVAKKSGDVKRTAVYQSIVDALCTI